LLFLALGGILVLLMSNLSTTKVTISFPDTLVRRAKQRSAEQFGFDFPELVRKLVADYIEDVTGEWVDPEYSKILIQAKKETDAEIAAGTDHTSYSWEAFKKDLEADLV
jgi:hypothetical protein